MKLEPPPTDREVSDLMRAYREHIPENDYVSNPQWYNIWGIYLIALRRGYQRRFLSEAYNEFSSHT